MTPLEKINRECREWTRMQMLDVQPSPSPAKWMVRGGDEIRSREFARPKGVFAVQHFAFWPEQADNQVKLLR